MELSTLEKGSSKKIKPKPVTSNKIKTITTLLEKRIRAGEWALDEKLPLQGELASDYGVSLGTIAIVLRNLQKMQLVQIIPNRGVFLLDQTQVEARSEEYPLIGLRGSYVGAVGSLSSSIVGEIVEIANTKLCPVLLFPLLPNGGRYTRRHDKSRGAEGGIFLGGGVAHEVHELKEEGFPLILANKPVGPTSLNYADYDHGAALKEVVNRFLDQGHRRIGVLYPETSTPGNFNSFFPEFLHTLAKRDCLYNGITEYWKCAKTTEEIEVAIEELFRLPEPPTALYSMGAYSISKIILFLKTKGIEVPRDVSIVGSCWSGSAKPPYSSFMLPQQKLAEILFEGIHKIIKNPHYSVQKLIPLSFHDGKTVSVKKK